MDDLSPHTGPLTRRLPLAEEVNDCRGLLGQDPDVIQDVCRHTRTERPLGREIRYMSPDSPVLMIEPLRVDTVELTHPPREIGVGCLDQEVIVVCHKAIGMTDPVVPCKHINTDTNLLVNLCNLLGE